MWSLVLSSVAWESGALFAGLGRRGVLLSFLGTLNECMA
ncbi:unannotated protein [freshwater metagenome]|uniref:Unannotated protein n=1 Tax=freshwater metagenome TaxID=449393 RepID=A0A6J6JQZ9_9ZZZZ